MSKLLFVSAFILFIGALFAGPGDEAVFVTDYVRIVDAVTGEPLIGVEVSLSCTEETLFTDPDGMVAISYVKEEKCDLELSYISYADLTLALDALSADKEIALQSD